MSDALTKFGQNAWLWRAIIFKGVNGYLIAVAGAVLASHILTPFQESIVGCLITGSKFLDGFMNQDLGRIKQEMAQALGLSTGNTQFLTRQDTQQQTSVQTFSTSPPNETETPKPNTEPK
jgi:hypothetical protein